MPILIDVPGMFLAGSAIALASGRRISSGGRRGITRRVKTAIAFGALYGLSATILSFWREDWMWSYLMRPPLPTMAWVLGFWALLATSAGLGAWLTQREMRAGRWRRAWLVFGAAALVVQGIWGATLHPYLHVGTYLEYHDDLAFHLDQMPETWRILLISGAIDGALFLAILGLNRWLDRRPRKRAAV